MKSVIYATTATSGSQSLLRILDAILVPPYSKFKTPETGDANWRPTDLEEYGSLYLARGMSGFNANIYDRRFRYIVNFRDPRDKLCNQYYWLTQHPVTANSEAESRKIQKSNESLFNKGIDNFVLRTKDDAAYQFVYELQAAAEAGGDVLFVSYAQLCCEFDIMIDRIQDFLGVEITDSMRKRIDNERTEKLDDNPLWIGVPSRMITFPLGDPPSSWQDGC